MTGSGSGKGGDASARGGRAAARRRALLVFGAAFVILFAVVAIAEGLGDPSVPSGDVAVIEDAPDGLGEITQAEFDHALELTAAASKMKVPKPSDPQYDELKEATLKSMLEAVWIQGLAEERGIAVSDKELDKELKNAIDASFEGSKKKFKKFLKEAHYTDADVDEKVKLQALSTKLQESLEKEGAEPTQDEIEDYYEAAKGEQFTQAETRDVRSIVNKDREKAEKALARLEKDNSPKEWRRVAKKLSEDAATKESGGLQAGASEELFEEPLKAAAFSAAEGQLEGPLDGPNGFVVFEVTGINPETVQDLKDVEETIESTLAQRLQQEMFADFVSDDFQLAWKLRTFCADDYLSEQCANFEAGAHPAMATPSCYEEDPKDGRPADCPAPVFQLIPAMPGTVTPLQPKGEQLAQRPRPISTEQSEEAASATLPG